MCKQRPAVRALGIVLWLDVGHAALRAATRTMLEAHLRARNALCVSAITAWEFALLAVVGRIELDPARTPGWRGFWLDRASRRSRCPSPRRRAPIR